MLSEYGFCITIEGGKRVVADGVKRVVSFSKDCVSLLIGRNVYDVLGTGLLIEEVQEGVVAVIGDIVGVLKK